MTNAPNYCDLSEDEMMYTRVAAAMAPASTLRRFADGEPRRVAVPDRDEQHRWVPTMQPALLMLSAHEHRVDEESFALRSSDAP